MTYSFIIVGMDVSDITVIELALLLAGLFVIFTIFFIVKRKSAPKDNGQPINPPPQQ